MRRFLHCLFIVFVFGWILSVPTRAEDFVLTNGDVYKGQAASYGEEGLIVRQDIGVFSQRVHWIKLSQETLKRLAQNPKIAPFAEPFIELPMDTAPKKAVKEIKIKPVQRPERVTEKPTFIAALSTPVGLAILGFLFLGNLYAAYEIALYRSRPFALVCSVSAILPFVGPILFLATPSAGAVVIENPEEESPAAAEATNPLAATGAKNSGLSVAGAHDKGASAGGDATPKVYKKGEITFNRRWFETTFTGFFRVIPSEAEKNLVLVVKCGRNEYVAKRITRISMTELHLQLLSGGEVSANFDEIHEVQVRHKDAKA